MYDKGGDMPPLDGADLDFLRQLEQSVSLAPASESAAVLAGPFRAFFSPFTPDPELNYAMPIAQPEGPNGFPAALAAARQIFAVRQRRLRLEFTEELWPELARAAEQEGLDLVGREPLMVCSPEEFQPALPSEVSVALLSPDATDETLVAFLRIWAEVFDDGPPRRRQYAPAARGSAERQRLARAGDAGWAFRRNRAL
jgi:hypothetical protein